MARIVVGVDGSQESKAALTFALEEARLRNLPLRIVAAWEVPPIEYTGAVMVATADLSEQAEEQAQKVASEAAATASGSGIRVETVVQAGHPPDVLVDQAGDATLLVVGSRGRGGLASLLLGSVSTAVAHHATCPVTIVRPPEH